MIFFSQFMPKLPIYIDHNILNSSSSIANSQFFSFFKKYSNIINLSIIFFYVTLINKILSSIKLKFKDVYIGSLLTVACWLIFSKILILYFEEFSQFNLIYGSLANIVAILLYLYMIFLCFILGSEVNATLLKKNST